MVITTKNIFPRIKNRSNFLFNHPVLHPDTTAYQDYWYEQMKRCIEGYWGIDSKNLGEKSWRFMTGPLYFCVNMFEIKIRDSKKKKEWFSRPYLVDFFWTYFNIWIICKGFSGFENDEEYTCNWTVKLMEDKALNPNLPDIAPHILEYLDEYCYKKDGSLKKYIDPLEYLNKTHEAPLGKPVYGNPAQNFFLLGSRAGGKSYAAASIILHDFLTDGAKRMSDFIKKEANIEIFVGSAVSSKSEDLLEKVMDGMDRLPGKYIDGVESRPSPFFKQCSGSLAVGGMYKHEYQKNVGGQWSKAGTKSYIKHETFAKNKQAAVGGRYATLVNDEVGLEERLLEVHRSNESCQQIDGMKFGSSWYGGTGGDMDKIVESEIIFRDPESYQFLAFEDIYENRGHIGFFLPATMVNLDFKDEEGNTDMEKALAFENYQREQKKKAKNQSAYDGYIMNRPLKPSEMFLSKSGNKFPQALLRLQQAENDKKNIEKYIESIGIIEKDENAFYGVKFTPKDLKPLRRYTLDSNNDLKGALVIYEHPNDIIPSNLYKVVYDPIRDENGGTSLASIIVYKGKNTIDNTGNSIVAQWAGRYDKPDDIHELAVNIAKYFNAMIMFENNIPDFKNYCLRTKNYHLMAPTPYQAISRVIKESSNKWDVGINMNKALSEYAEKLALQWLLDERKVYEQDGELVTIRNYQTIHDNALLDEFISYNSDGNFDRVSAFKLLMIWLEQENEEIISFVEKESKKAISDFYTYLQDNKTKLKPIAY